MEHSFAFQIHTDQRDAAHTLCVWEEIMCLGRNKGYKNAACILTSNPFSLKVLVNTYVFDPSSSAFENMAE